VRAEELGHIAGWNELVEEPSRLVLRFVCGREIRPAVELSLHRVGLFRDVVPENRRGDAAVEIQIFVSVDVGQRRPLPSIHVEQWVRFVFAAPAVVRGRRFRDLFERALL